MTAVANVDLYDEASGAAPLRELTQVLVWAGDEALGTSLVRPAADGSAASSRDILARRYGAHLLARSSVRARPSPAALSASDVTVVVCTRDRAALLADGLAALGALDPAPADVLVVDNAPTSDATRRAAATAGCSYTVEPRPGLNHARNRGWRTAGSPVVLYVDDDARAHRRLAGAVGTAFAAPAVAAVTGLVAPAELRSRAQRLFERQGGMGKGFLAEAHGGAEWALTVQPYRLGVGTNMAFRRDVLAELGGFDPALDVGTATRGGGDLDMLYRVVLAGGSVVYEPDAVVRHVHRPDLAGLLTQVRDNGTSFSALLTKYEASPALSAAARRERRRWHLRRHVGAPLGALARGEPLLAGLLLTEAVGSARGRSALREAGRVAAAAGAATHEASRSARCGTQT